MPKTFILASGSSIRAELLGNAKIPFEVQRPRVDEETIRRSMVGEGLSPRDMADHLAELKAEKVARRFADALVLGCDQVLEFEGEALTKPDSPDTARAQLDAMSGKAHKLHSAAVLFEGPRPVWRHVSTVTMTMRSLSPDYIDAYVTRNWEEIRHCVGAYQLESEGVRLFSQVDGDFFSVLGLPFLPLLDHLAQRGVIET